MGRYIRWQAILALAGIAMTLSFLGFLSQSRTTIVIPDVGGIYSEAVVGMPQFINPLLAQYNQVDQDLSALIFNGLTRMNGQGRLTPDLAQSWQVSDDGKTYTFTLRRDIRWHNGQRFDADDVLFTIALMQDPEFPGLPNLGRLWQSVTVEKLDNYTVRFVLPEFIPTFAEFTTIGMLPEHLLKDMPARDLLNHPFNLQPVGTGPFALDDVNAEVAQLSANPFYTGPKPKLAGVELKFFTTFDDAIAAYQAGDVQGISHIPPGAIDQVRGLESLNLYTARLSGYNIIYLNLQNPEIAPFFQEAAVRQALLYGLNRQQIIDEAINGQGIVAGSPILPWSWAYNPEQPTIGYDPDQATSLLDENGWIDTDGNNIRDKEGQPLAFSLITSDDPARISAAKNIANQWQRIGISVTVEIAGDMLAQRLAQHDFQAALAEVLLAGDPDPYPFWHQTQIAGGQNYAGWDNATASQLLESARATTDRGHRNDYYFQFQRIFAEEVPSLILYHPLYTYGVSQDVFDVQLAPMINPADRFRTISNWYVLTRRVIYKESQFEYITPQPLDQSQEDKP